MPSGCWQYAAPFSTALARSIRTAADLVGPVGDPRVCWEWALSGRPGASSYLSGTGGRSPFTCTMYADTVGGRPVPSRYLRPSERAGVGSGPHTPRTAPNHRATD